MTRATVHNDPVRSDRWRWGRPRWLPGPRPFLPDSKVSNDVREIIGRLEGTNAREVTGAVDRDFGRRAYVSAHIYFEDVVENYPDTEWAPTYLESEAAGRVESASKRHGPRRVARSKYEG